jgi:SAM-dependent methyltransferase
MIRKILGYYLLASYRRKILDSMLQKHAHIYKGVVLDIGGRDRGKFRSPKDKVDKWVVTDIEKSRNPDLVLDVCAMKTVRSESVDVINALELFEHVKEPEKGVTECFRVLKKGGAMILSMPFLYPVHADPCDFQRWTDQKLRWELGRAGFSIEKIELMGGFFTVLADMTKTLNQAAFPLIRYTGFFLYPILDILTLADRLTPIKNSRMLGKYTTGYFVIAKKPA